MSSKHFSHLHGHSHLSNMIVPDAISSPTALVEIAKEKGLTSIALTDHASVAGVPELAKAAEREGIKPVVGSELYVCEDAAWRPAKGSGERKDHNHCVALAQDWEGFQEICALLTQASDQPNFYYKPRNTFDEIAATKKVIYTTACQGGLLRRDDYEQRCVDLKNALGPDRFYLEIQPHHDDGQKEVNARALEMRDKLGLRIVAAQDFHYARPEDGLSHEILLAVRQKVQWNDPDRVYYYPREELYVRDRDEMLQAFARHIRDGALDVKTVVGAFETANDVVAQTDFRWQPTPISLPKMADDPNVAVMQKCMAEMKRRGLHQKPEYMKRLAYELRVMMDAGFMDYFLILAEVIGWSREQGIMVGPGRGSSGGSLICYMLGITQIDPIEHGLIFERFYRPGRGDLPDIDTDFDMSRREEVIQHIAETYGRENVAGVGNYNMLKGKSAIKDVARIFGINHVEVNAATGQVPTGPDLDVDPKVEAEEVFQHEAIRNLFAKYPTLGEHSHRLAGVMRSFGQHAAGVVISGVPIRDRAHVLVKDERRVVCWDKRVIEEMGLMKLDLLGLRTMSILREARDNVKARHGIDLVYEELPLDDAQTLAIFNNAQTTGVFQFESRGMRGLLKSLNVDQFSVIADAVSLYRPGPMDLIPQYEAAQTGKVQPFYLHEKLKPILEPTFGIMVYQEQMMQVFVEIGGFDYTHADKMRKIVGKKLGPDEFKKHEGDFVSGAVANGVSERDAREIFNKMVSFAGYAFNKSHAVAYSIIAYWCAYMKAHYPADFFAAHLSSTGDADKLQLAVTEVMKDGIDIQMPNINVSEAERFVPASDRTIVAPLSAIKKVGEKAAHIIVGARQGKVDPNGLAFGETRKEAKRGDISFDMSKVKSGAFTDQADFEARVYKRIVNKGVIERLQAVGAFPWNQPIDEALVANRKEHLPDLYREVITVDDEALCDLSERNVRKLTEFWGVVQAQMKKSHKEAVMMSAGSKPRVMLVFPKPTWPDVQKGKLANGLNYDIVRNILKDAFGWNHKDLYVTSFYRTDAPPLGYETMDADCEKLLNAEINLVKPPVILAFGSKPIAHFSGGKRVGEMHGKMVMFGKVPVICARDPNSVVMDFKSGEIDRDKHAELRSFVDALSDLYR